MASSSAPSSPGRGGVGGHDSQEREHETEEEEGKGAEEKFPKPEVKSQVVDDPFCVVHSEAQAAFLDGEIAKAQQLLKSFNSRELMDDDYHHELFLEKGHNHRMIYRNNLAILKEATLAGGSAEVLFRVSLDDAFKYTQNPVLAQSLSHAIMEKLEKEIDMVRYNLALSWLMNPNHSRAAYSGLIYGIRQFPTNIRLWLHAAEACISYLSSKNKKDFMFPPLSSDFDLCNRLENDSDNLQELKMIKDYFPGLDKPDNTDLPSFEFAQMCMMNAKRLANRDSRISGNLLPEPATPRDGPVEESLNRTILITFSYIALRLQKFRQCLVYANKVLASKNVPRVQKVLVKCYKDLSLFLLGEADCSIFTPVVFEEDCDGKDEENERKFLAYVNVTRKYHKILGSIMDPINASVAVGRLEEYVNKNNDHVSRAAITMFLSMYYKNAPSDTPTSIQNKIYNLHRLLISLSPMYRREISKKESAEGAVFHNGNISAIPESTQQTIWALMNEIRCVPAAKLSMPAAPKDLKGPSKPIYIKLSHKGGKSIRIPW